MALLRSRKVSKAKIKKIAVRCFQMAIKTVIEVIIVWMN